MKCPRWPGFGANINKGNIHESESNRYKSSRATNGHRHAVRLFSLPVIGFAQPSNTNNGSPTVINNANTNGLQNSNVNGIGTGTAPVPESSTYVAMATLLAAAAYARRRRRVAQ
jgi:hypothetical protein